MMRYLLAYKYSAKKSNQYGIDNLIHVHKTPFNLTALLKCGCFLARFDEKFYAKLYPISYRLCVW